MFLVLVLCAAKNFNQSVQRKTKELCQAGMKKTLLLLFAAVGIFATCRKESALEEKIITVSSAGCKTETFSNESVTLCFDSLIQDSRCPINANCVWQGVGQGRFSFTLKSVKYNFVLSTNDALPGTHTDTTIQNYHISLTNLQPYPGSLLTVMPYAEVKVTRR